MAQYFTLFFDSTYGNSPVLKTWLIQNGQKVKKGSPLFLYGEGAQQKSFASPISGTSKVILWREGDSLYGGCGILVLSVAPKEAKVLEKNGQGKILHPEELKQLAEAASIRLPPE